MASTRPGTLAPTVDPFLTPSEWIDADHPDVIALAGKLRGADDVDTARRCFAWVRDEVRHSSDHRVGPATCRASDALRHRAGFCFAKAHLLAALLRANGIPAGLCYQRLSLDGAAGPWSLHGLVAARLPGFGWYRMDPRGNKPGVDARFTPPVERLAFAVGLPGEWDDPTPRAQPLPEVVACLTKAATWEDVLATLPDRAQPT